MERVKTGVIGLGRMGRHHCRVYATLRDSQLLGIYDTNPIVSQEYSALYDVPVYQDIDELLEHVEAVSIATPTPTHFHIVKRCLEHGVHVLVEKPITETIENAEKLTRMVDSGGPIVLVGHIERFNPTYLELKKVIEDMKVLAINFRRLSPYRGSNKDVDVVLDLMVHDLDLSIDLTGKEPGAINAFGLNPFSDGLDHVSAQLCYAGGPLITLTASRITEEKVRCVEVTAEQAFVEADFQNKSISIHRCSTGEYFAQNHSGVKYRQESLIERILVPSAEPLGLEIKHFLDCVGNKCSPSVSVRDGLRALRLAQQIRDVVSEHNIRLFSQPEPVNQ
jgi:predicted dehydrogenase